MHRTLSVQCSSFFLLARSARETDKGPSRELAHDRRLRRFGRRRYSFVLANEVGQAFEGEVCEGGIC